MQYYNTDSKIRTWLSHHIILKKSKNALHEKNQSNLIKKVEISKHFYYEKMQKISKMFCYIGINKIIKYIVELK